MERSEEFADSGEMLVIVLSDLREQRERLVCLLEATWFPLAICTRPCSD
jgi:hypothetical protein